MMAEMIVQMISVMIMEVFGDYYCLVLMIQMGPGVMYEMGFGWTGCFTVCGDDDDVIGDVIALLYVDWNLT